KAVTVAGVADLQGVVLVAIAVAVGWSVSATESWGEAVLVMVLGTVAFAGLGLLMAGTMRGEMVLAAANGLYLLLLLLGGMVVPLSKLPGILRPLARALPAGALSDALHHSLGGTHVPSGSAYWLVLAAWAIAAPVAAALTF